MRSDDEVVEIEDQYDRCFMTNICNKGELIKQHIYIL